MYLCCGVRRQRLLVSYNTGNGAGCEWKALGITAWCNTRARYWLQVSSRDGSSAQGFPFSPLNDPPASFFVIPCLQLAHAILWPVDEFHPVTHLQGSPLHCTASMPLLQLCEAVSEGTPLRSSMVSLHSRYFADGHASCFMFSPSHTPVPWFRVLGFRV